jgi:heptosyltransferase-2
MNIDSDHSIAVEDAEDTRPILIVPYMWIGDFVRGHSVVRVLNQRFPNRPVDLLTTTLCAPLVDYMPGVRAGVVWDLPRSRLALAEQRGLAATLKARKYATALVLPRAGLHHRAAPMRHSCRCGGAGPFRPSATG